VPNELKNAEHLGLTVCLARPTMKSSYIGLGLVAARAADLAGGRPGAQPNYGQWSI